MRDDHAEICELFASKADDKFGSVAWTPGLGGVPILHEGAVAHAECVTLEELEIGDHVVVTGRVEAGAGPTAGRHPDRLVSAGVLERPGAADQPL